MDEFGIKVSQQGDVSVLRVKGYLDAHTAPELEKRMQELISQDRVRLVMELAELEYISSAGLGVFMAYVDEVRGRGGDIKFSSLTPRVYTVFDLLGFPILYEFFPETGEAVKRFPHTDSADRGRA